MNSPTIVDDLKRQLKNAKAENAHINAVCQELQDMLTVSKCYGRNASDSAANAKIQLDHALTQLAVLKRDVVNLKPDYDFSLLGKIHAEMYQAQSSDQLCRVLLSIQNPDAWSLISKHPAKVIANLIDIRTGLISELQTGLANFSAGDGSSLLEAIGKSAADLLFRGEI